MGPPSSSMRSAVALEPHLMLVEEISHRVLIEYTHAIASIVLAAAETRDVRLGALLNSTADRLRAMAAAHRALQLPVLPGTVDLGQHLGQVCAAHSSAYLSERGLGLTLVHSAVMLSAQRCWLVGLIVSELIHNAVRHAIDAGGREVRIEITSESGWVLCRVSDDGAPLCAPAPGRGMCIVERLARDLGGEVDWKFTAQGTSVVLIVPAEGDHAGPDADLPLNAAPQVA